MAVTNGTKTGRSYPEETWDDMKPLITQKYIIENLTLQQTMQAMQSEAQFMATEKMYKTRFKKWGFSKYIKDEKALEVLTSDDNRHRSHTIAGKPITKEDAERHFRRKKGPNRPATWAVRRRSSQQNAPNGDSMVIDDTSDFLVSPVHDQPFPQNEIPWPTSSPDWTGFDSFSHRGSLTQAVYSPVVEDQDDVDDIEMDMDITDMASGADQNHLMLYGQNEQTINPQILMSNLTFTTEQFLWSLHEFADLTMQPVVGRTMPPLTTQRFNKLWDIFCTKAAHEKQNKISHVTISRRDAQKHFKRMLLEGDPWLLQSLCLLLEDNLANPERVAMSSSFLNDMADWAEEVQPNHPISQLVRFLQQTSDARGESAPLLLEGAIRMVVDSLKAVLGQRHDLAVEVSRLHSKILTSPKIKMHATAISMLSQDLALAENISGADTLKDLLTRSSLARAHFMAENFEQSLLIYQQILDDPLVNEPYLADVQYGAMFFCAKNNARLGNADMALAYAQTALDFGVSTEGPDHYWATHAKELINEVKRTKATIGKYFFEIK